MVNRVEILTRMIDRAVDIVIYIALFRTIRPRSRGENNKNVFIEQVTQMKMLNYYEVT